MQIISSREKKMVLFTEEHTTIYSKTSKVNDQSNIFASNKPGYIPLSNTQACCVWSAKLLKQIFIVEMLCWKEIIFIFTV